MRETGGEEGVGTGYITWVEERSKENFGGVSSHLPPC